MRTVLFAFLEAPDRRSLPTLSPSVAAPIENAEWRLAFAPRRAMAFLASFATAS